MARPAPLRIRASAVVALTTACALLSACGSAPHPAAAPAAGSAAPSGGSAPATAGVTGNGTAADASYVLGAPQVAAGYPQGLPSADLVRMVNGDIAQTAERLGVSGTPVHAYYDDRADGAWIFYSGVTGTGFNPDHLYTALDQAPAVSTDGAGDRITTNAIGADPGPHGGRAICNTVLVQNVVLTTGTTSCSWFTATTAASITLVIKGDGSNTKVGFTAADVAPIMRAIRADVERPQQ